MLVDTNVWSELTKPSPNEQVRNWVVENFSACLVSTIVLAEMRYGIAVADDDVRRRDLIRFHDDLMARIGDRIVPFDDAASATWGALKARLKRTGKPIADMDLLIAAHAIALGVPLVTRNSSDMARTGALIINLWPV